MKKKLFNKIFISLITISILLSSTVLAETDNVVRFKEYLLNNFSINIESESYITSKDKSFEEDINFLINESITNITKYSDVKSQEVEENLIAYGNIVKENIYRQVDEIKNNLSTSYGEESSNIVTENNYNETIETEPVIETGDINE